MSAQKQATSEPHRSSSWTPQQAWQWHAERPWIVGMNFLPSSCMNGIEIWQEDGFEGVLGVAETELAIAEAIGFNTVRMVIPFFVWEHQRDGFVKRLDRFLSMAQRHGMQLMPVLFDDCTVPRGLRRAPRFGRQADPVPGHHGGVVETPFDGGSRIGWHACDEPENHSKLTSYVRDLVGRFRSDERIVMWDVWNEPGNGNRGSRSLDFLVHAFEIAREQQPIQPLTAGAWNFGDGVTSAFRGLGELSEIESRAIELSDVVSFHFYGRFADTRRLVSELKRLARPLVITEWLHRIFGNDLVSHLPYFQDEKIGCLNWGLVNGKTQTHEPWDSIRSIPGLDLSLWQHDLFRPDGTAYDPAEISLIRELTATAKQ